MSAPGTTRSGDGEAEVGTDAAGHPLDRIRRRRRITGMSALLLPYTDAGDIDWAGFEGLLGRTVDAGLVPAVNMDTGFGALLDPETRAEVLRRARTLVPGEVVAGAYLDDAPGDPLDVAGVVRAVTAVAEAGATPIVFPCHGLAGAPEAQLPELFATVGSACDRFLAFELGTMFSPAGRIFAPATYRALLDVPACVGAKHSSLDRALELERLALRDAVRPDFLVLTGNDLAIDMVMFGSDYLLGLSAFAPDAFARRDRAWAEDDPAFFALDDVLQYLGRFAFRTPVPAYKHDAAVFLHLRGWLGGDGIHPRAERRPDGDRDVLAGILADLEALLA